MALTLLTLLYDIIVMPLVYVVDFVFSLLMRGLSDPGLALIGVSLVVNLLCLPLYRMADRAQDEERQRQKRMEYRTEQIKRSFKGDERYMMLSTYYRQQGYKPIYALNGSFSLLLQIPVFMAAYGYLSSCEALKGASFLFLSDLGAPDGLIVLGNVTLNLMPLLMTLLNVVSTAIYTRDLALRDKVQAYGLALVFLVLLYQSPSGLVLYWTCNQLFSLGKNVVQKLLPKPDWHLPRNPRWKQWSIHPSTGVTATPIFLAGSCLLAILLGVLIPSALLAASPQEFASASGFDDPIRFVVHTGCVSFGFFVLWVGTYFFLSGEGGRKAIAYTLGCLGLIALVNYFFFDSDLGIISATLVYEDPPVFSPDSVTASIMVLIAMVVVFTNLWKIANRVVAPLLGILAVGLLGLCVPNIAAVITGKPAAGTTTVATSAAPVAEDAESTLPATDFSEGQVATREVPFDAEGNPLPIINLSRDGRNVVVLYLDRGMSGFVPFIFNERPDLYEKYDGFTYYPNTISFGLKTVFGAPAVFGGYDYTPTRMNERDEELLVDKHNEALRLMPRLFSDAGFGVTVCDLPLANYEYYTSDFSLLDDIPHTRAYKTVGTYTQYYVHEVLTGSSTDDPMSYESLLEENARRFSRNLIYYSFFRVAPTCLKEAIYDHGNYLAPQVGGNGSRGFVSDFCARVREQLGFHSDEPTEAVDPRGTIDANARIDGERFDAQVNVMPAEGDAQPQPEGGDEPQPEGQPEEVVEDQTEQPAEETTEGQPAEGSEGEGAVPPEAEAGSEETAAPAEPAYQVSEYVDGLTHQFQQSHNLYMGLFNSYSVLHLLPTLTEVTDNAGDQFVVVANWTTHEPDLLQLPNYEPRLQIDNNGLFNPSAFVKDGQVLRIQGEYSMEHYMVNMAALLRLGEWFDYLREQGCYDNTRIIIVSDHAESLGLFDNLKVGDFEAEGANPILMVKDFGAHGFATSDEFMTNGDTPTLALRDIVADPINPATGNPVNSDEKTAHEQLITTSGKWDVRESQAGTVFDTSDGLWYSVHDSIFDPNNWAELY